MTDDANSSFTFSLYRDSDLVQYWGNGNFSGVTTYKDDAGMSWKFDIFDHY